MGCGMQDAPLVAWRLRGKNRAGKRREQCVVHSSVPFPPTLKGFPPFLITLAPQAALTLCFFHSPCVAGRPALTLCCWAPFAAVGARAHHHSAPADVDQEGYLLLGHTPLAVVPCPSVKEVGWWALNALARG
jgi:hypothetical protein